MYWLKKKFNTILVQNNTNTTIIIVKFLTFWNFDIFLCNMFLIRVRNEQQKKTIKQQTDMKCDLMYFHTGK